MELVVEAKALLDVLYIQECTSIKTEVLLKWKHLPYFEAIWEDMDTIHARFPSFHLEDKVSLLGGGGNGMNSNPPPLLTYACRKGKGRSVK